MNYANEKRQKTPLYLYKTSQRLLNKIWNIFFIGVDTVEYIYVWSE